MISETSDLLCFLHQSFPFRINKITGTTRFDRKGDEDEKAHLYEEDVHPLHHSEDYHDEVTWEDIERNLPQLTTNRLRSVPDGHLVFFWASSVFFTVERPNDEKEPSVTKWYQSKPSVKNCRGEYVGTVDRMDEFPPENEPQEFIMIGRRAIKEIPDFPAVVLALQICWENGIAYRLNIAEIQETAWRNARPSRKLIALM